MKTLMALVNGLSKRRGADGPDDGGTDLDLDNNCQSPDGYFGNGVCTPTGVM